MNITCNSSEKTHIQFEVNISNLDNVGLVPLILFTVIGPNKIRTSFEASTGEAPTYVVTVPANAIPNGKYKCQIEVIIGDRIYIPTVGNATFGLAASPTVDNVEVIKDQDDTAAEIEIEKAPIQEPEVEPVVEPKVEPIKDKEDTLIDLTVKEAVKASIIRQIDEATVSKKPETKQKTAKKVKKVTLTEPIDPSIVKEDKAAFIKIKKLEVIYK